jgi:hypothetical protein
LLAFVVCSVGAGLGLAVGTGCASVVERVFTYDA